MKMNEKCKIVSRLDTIKSYLLNASLEMDIEFDIDVAETVVRGIQDTIDYIYDMECEC